jgi:antirestriction protein ArdC
MATKGSTWMARKEWTKDEAVVARTNRVAAALAVLDSAVSGLRSGEDWTRYLDFQSRLYNYSANNVMLLVAQHMGLHEQGKVATPIPSYVASYRKWLELGRQVEKGQTGLAIIAPMRGTRRLATDADGAVVRVLGKDEQLEPGEQEVRTSFMRGFTVEKVFSAEQTTGEPLPKPPRPQLLQGEAPRGLGGAVMALIESKGFTVDTVPHEDFIQGANGVTNFATKTVQIRDNIADAAMVKTLLHEAAHVLLHDPADPKRPGNLTRGLGEVEAESVAFVIARVHGMDTDDYSFPYIAGWAGSEDPHKIITKTAQRVAQAAQAIIEVSPAEHGHGGKAALALTPPTKEAEPALAADLTGIGV